ncbi:uncharacterized protein LOC126114868 [Schistocerca cancellata]|uniref:uncharacterized protein LOC126114868 n=1 Tax=Schistocerca cancellata TaxID=274614 RepID=UPI00211982A5|nr:uncharacterized protein LOC126114868 [Schistocerca cancellata]
MTPDSQTDKSMATSTPPASELPYDSEQGKVPSLLTVCLLIDIPVIKAILDKSKLAWQRVKEDSPAAKWSLSAVELTARSAAKQGRILGWLFRIPIGIADRAVSGRIIEAERRWPILKESPNKVVEVTMERLRGRLWSCYTASGVVAADGKRVVAALADFTRKVVSSVQTSVQQSLTNFEDLVDEMASRAAGESRVVEGHSSGTSEASGPPAARPPVTGLVRRALESGLYLCVGGAVCALSAVPVVGRFAEALRESAGPQQPEAGSRQMSPRASPAPSSRTSMRSPTVDGKE